MIYGYARVSTRNQATDGNSIEAQEMQLKEAGAQVIFKDVFTGTKMNRPELELLLSMVASGDTIAVTKLDRIARSTEDGLKIMRELIDRGVSIHVLNMGLINDSPTGKLIFTVLLAFAEFERNMIIERTKEGREIARLNPEYKEGRKKKFTRQQIQLALELLETKSYSQVTKMTGISKSTLIRAKKESEVN